MPESVLLQRAGAIARIVLNRPEKRNALNPEMVRELAAALADTAADVEIRVVAISGAGKDFCAGADLAAIRSMMDAGARENVEDARALGDLFLAMRKHPLPIVALVHG